MHQITIFFFLRSKRRIHGYHRKRIPQYHALALVLAVTRSLARSLARSAAHSRLLRSDRLDDACGRARAFHTENRLEARRVHRVVRAQQHAIALGLALLLELQQVGDRGLCSVKCAGRGCRCGWVAEAAGHESTRVGRRGGHNARRE